MNNSNKNTLKMLHFNTKLNKMKSTIRKLKSEITIIQKKNEQSISNKPNRPNCSSMKQFLKPGNTQSGTDDNQQVSSNQINADYHTNYFIIPKAKNKSSNTNSAREKKLIAENEKNSITAKAGTPIKLTCNKDIDKLIEGSSYRHLPFKHNKTCSKVMERDNDMTFKPRNNMFLNFTQDVVPRKPSSNIISKYNSFDCRVNQYSIGGEETKLKDDYKTILNQIGQVFNNEVLIDNLPERVKISYSKAIEVDELTNDLLKIYKPRFNINQLDYIHVGNWIRNANLKHELYAQQIELYRALCEELIRQTDVNALEEISYFANSIANNSSRNPYVEQKDNFVRSVNAMIRNKYIASERSENTQINTKHIQRGAEAA